MKILLLGDASNYHYALSQGLARLGHDVTVASNGSRWMDTRRNIDLRRRPGRLGGAWLWVKLNTLLARDLRGYDVVQLVNPNFVELRPGRIRQVFDRVRRSNGSVFLTMLGTDSRYVRACVGPECPLRYNEWSVGGEPSPYALEHPERLQAWLGPELTAHADYVYDHVDGVVAALYEYYKISSLYVPSDRLTYGGIAIDEAQIGASGAAVEPGAPVRILLACHRGREAEKGADRLLPVLRALEGANPGRVVVDLVQNAPYEQFKQLLERASIVVDQLYSYTPATTALMAMARGKAVVSGGNEEYYHFIGEGTRPIIDADPERLDALLPTLQRLVDNPQQINALGAMGPDFVMRHNASQVVASRFVDFWERRMR